MAAHDPLVGESDIPECSDDLDRTQLSLEEALSQPLGDPSLPTLNAHDILTGNIQDLWDQDVIHLDSLRLHQGTPGLCFE